MAAMAQCLVTFDYFYEGFPVRSTESFPNMSESSLLSGKVLNTNNRGLNRARLDTFLAIFWLVAER